MSTTYTQNPPPFPSKAKAIAQEIRLSTLRREGRLSKIISEGPKSHQKKCLHKGEEEGDLASAEEEEAL